MAVAGVGQTIGKYQLEELAGRGSMAEVYRARRLDNDEIVALKLIHPHLLSNPSQFERFRREAEVLKKIRHRHIARLYDFVVEKGAAYMVMEYLGGGTLEKQLADLTARRQLVSLEQASEWMGAICSAVETAHRSGVVHRDLKPANILLRDDGDPVLTDFGLVYWIDQPRLSGTGSVTGTPAYISPEQARGQAGDRRSDVYSLGVILYEMLAGQPPFSGNTLGVAVKHISELPPSPRVLGRYLPPGVEAVVMRALAKDPIERYQSAQLLADALALAISKASAMSAATQRAAARPAPIVSLAAAPSSTAAAAEAEAEVSYSAPAAPSGSVRQWLAPALALPAIGLLVAGAWWLAMQFSTTTPEGASSAPRFAVGASVRVVTHNPQLSASVLRGCPTGFWMGVLGVASDGDEARILDRRVCSDKWWYRISIPAAVDSEWDGVGWVDGVYLEIR